MFQKQANAKNDLKSDNVRLSFANEASPSTLSNNDFRNKNERITQPSHQTSSATKQTPYQNYLSNIPREEIKSQKLHVHQQQLQRTSNFHSLSQQANAASREMQSATSTNTINQQHNLNQRNGLIQNSMIRSTTNPQINQVPIHPLHEYATGFQPTPSSSTQTKSAFNNACDITNTGSSGGSSNGDSRNGSGRHQLKQRLTSNYSSTPTATINGSYSHSSTRDGLGQSTHKHQDNHQQQQQHQMQQDRETNEVVTMIKGEMENNFIENFKESDLDTLGSLDLPIELSFLLRQQAVCMAKMNYLDRQIRELKEARQQPQQYHQQVPMPATSNHNQIHSNRTNTNLNNITATPATATHIKNGNFIPSDDSGGEYSRATISDDDELSSLLDQIAKSVRPDRNFNPNTRLNNSISHPPQPQPPHHHHLHQQHQRANYNVMTQPPQQYAILTPNHQLHHQAVPVFVMSSPIAMTHPSSISSTVLPGVHFQPEPRYNQFYEDFYVQNNNHASSTTVLHAGPRHSGLRSSQQFDSHLSAIEQLVAQKEKRQIKSQLKSADNWLKMRSSGLCNGNFSESNNGTATSNGTVIGGEGAGSSTSNRNIADPPNSSEINRAENSSGTPEE